MDSSVVSPEDVLASLMNDGTIDTLRAKIINQLKSNEDLKNSTITMVEQSKVLNTPGAEKQTKRELIEALRQELETSVLDKASKSAWQLILDTNALGKEINETVEKVYCRLSGQNPPLFPPSNADESEPQNAESKEREEEQTKETEKETEKSDSPSKKKNHKELSVQAPSEKSNAPNKKRDNKGMISQASSEKSDIPDKKSKQNEMIVQASSETKDGTSDYPIAGEDLSGISPSNS